LAATPTPTPVSIPATVTIRPNVDYADTGTITGKILGLDGELLITETELFCASLQRGKFLVFDDPSSYILTEKVYGNFRIEGLPPGQYKLVAVAKDDTCFSEKVITVTVDKDNNTQQDMPLVPGGSITGHVSGIKPEMVESSYFIVDYYITNPDFGWTYYHKNILVKDDGTYSIDSVPPGTIRIYVNNSKPKGYSSTVKEYYSTESTVVTVRSDEQTQQDFTIINK
jgi:hypothetical protein